MSSNQSNSLFLFFHVVLFFPRTCTKVAVNICRGCCKKIKKICGLIVGVRDCRLLTLGHPGWEDKKCSSCKNWAIISGLLWSSPRSQWRICWRIRTPTRSAATWSPKTPANSSKLLGVSSLDLFQPNNHSEVFGSSSLNTFFFVFCWRQSYSAGFSCNRKCGCHLCGVTRWLEIPFFCIFWEFFGKQISNRNGHPGLILPAGRK